tara:strand:- start:428 stop:1330 length:903 start_codon:yes stop_codon:yes gene_type:complete
MQVIVLGGIARVGKTEVADIIEMEAALAGKNPKRISFSTPLKEACAERNGYKDPRKFKDEMPEVYRAECQELGARKRAENEDHWVDLWVNMVLEEQKKELNQPVVDDDWQETVIICDDCRYENEIAAVKGFEAVRIFIYKGERTVDEEDAAWRAHESEWMAQKIEGGHEDMSDRFNWSIVNDKGLEALEEKLLVRMPHFLGDHPARFTRQCDCAECRSFQHDVQPTELIAGFEEARQEILDDPELSDEMKDRITKNFDRLIEEIESGEKSVQDLFNEDWWTTEFKEDIDDDDDDADDGSA